MARWTAHTRVPGAPEEVLDLLTEPGAIARWAPIDFAVVDWEGDRLSAGDRVRVEGRLAGRALAFDVDVAKADEAGLRLTADGPIRLDVAYRVRATAAGSDLHAMVNVSGRGIMGRVLAQATDALMASGALRVAVGRLADECRPALVAA
jgi:hypothetical protein